MDEKKYVTLEVHNEFAKRLEAENQRQNNDIDELKANVREIQRLTVSVEKMAVSMENMTTEIKAQSQRLSEIEKEPADRWRKLLSVVGAALVGAILAIVFSKIGLT